MKIEKPQIDSHTLRLLIRIKFLLMHALEHSNKRTEIDTFISFMGLDNVVENILHVIVTHLELDSKIKSNKNYSDLADYASQINSILKSDWNLKLPYISEIKLLRKTRNLIQHNLVNSGVDLDRFVRVTKKFFDFILNEIFQLSENDINDFMLVENEIVKNGLKESKTHLNNRMFLQSVVASRDAFENTWFEIIKSSEINFSSLSANMEAQKNNMFFAEYFHRIKEELIIIKLGVDSKNFERFTKYLQHIPSEFNANKKSGYTVMQRDWGLEDAIFCYDFVFDFVIKYQNSLNQPLYQVEQSFQYNSEEKYGDINISSGSEGHLSYLYSDNVRNHEMQLFYGDDNLKSKLENLKFGNKYVFEKHGFKNNKLDSIIKYETILHNISFELITNNPARWQIMILIEYVPFTWFRADYSNGKKVKESICINKVNSKKFKQEFGWIISDEKVAKIFNLRKAIGKIKSISDLKKIKNISIEEIEWVARFTRI